MLDKNLYPFKSNFLDINGQNYHYVNEGAGDPILMVHGNPTWSFYYRELIKEFCPTHQVIVPDHMGCGLSSKPQDYEYTLENHIQNLETLVKFLDLKNITLVVHDWGGAIGFGLATRYPELIKKVVILNTAAFNLPKIPFRISLCKLPVVGPFIVRAFNAFAWPATFMTTTKKLDKTIKKHYLMPYDNYNNRIAVANFVKDIPLNDKHPTFKTLDDIESRLKDLNIPKLIIWGGADFCFNDHFFSKWREIYPDADFRYFKDAGHYVIEDKKDEVIMNMREFI
ncbi:MAG: alpha/beta fold hydrolase [Bacteriovoracaceae bacterium]|jgi:haloalkane dehalogenase|nr:alpha/beta fold hydrolase [Bacteriovoracaceae bacterium]